MARDKVLVVGGGMMGCGIAAVAAAGGERVAVAETSEAVLRSGPARVEALLRELEVNGLMERGTLAACMERVSFTPALEHAAAEAGLAIEAIVENLEAKQALFERLDGLLPPEVTIASNTSGLRITDIGARGLRRERMVTAHFWFPAHLVPLVEVVMSEYSDLEAAQALCRRLKGWGKAPVLVRRDLPGQLANRILQAVIREASNIVEMGLASPEDVDTAVKMGMGIRFPVWGPLEHVDAVGVDLCRSVQNTVLPGISAAPRANETFETLVAEGKLGCKTGAGFYDWSKKDRKELEALRNAFIIQSVKFIRQWKGEG